MNALADNLTPRAHLPQETWRYSYSGHANRVVRDHLAAFARARLRVRRDWREGFRAGKAIPNTSFDALLRLHSRIVDITAEVRELVAMAPKKETVQ